MKSLRAPVAMHAILMAIVLLLSACKGSSSDTTPKPTLAVVKLSTTGTLPTGKKIGAIDVTLTLAPGVTLKSTLHPPASVPEPDAGVVTASGVLANNNTLIVAGYTASTSALPGSVRIGVASVNGFDTGEFVTINGDIAAGGTPRAADFSATINTISDTDSIPLTGLTAGIAVDIR